MSYHSGLSLSGVWCILLLAHALAPNAAWGQRTTYRVPLLDAIGRASVSDQSGGDRPLNPASHRVPERNARLSVPSPGTAWNANEPSSQLGPLRDKLRACLAHYYRQPEDATYRSPWGIMHSLLAFGVDTQVRAQGRAVNAIAYLCANGKGQDLRMFEVHNGRLQPRSGPGMQGHDAQFLFMMAQAKVPLDYPIRVDGYHFTIADLVEYEKDTCQSGSELNFKLVGLVHYLDSDATWRNGRGESWSISRIIQEELTQPIIGACCGGTHRMMGFSYAVHKRELRGEPLVGQWLRARKFVEDYHEYAFRLQHRDGSFSTDWFKSRRTSADMDRVLETTGHVTEWLTFSLPREELVAPRMLNAIEFLSTLLLDNRDRELEVGPKGHALHALSLFDERVFGGAPGRRSYLAGRS